MRKEVEVRVLAVAQYILDTGATVRTCAGRFGVSKTTIHKDVRGRLPGIDRALARRVDGVMKRNLGARHLRGGEATRRKHALAREARGRA